MTQMLWAATLVAAPLVLQAQQSQPTTPPPSKSPTIAVPADTVSQAVPIAITQPQIDTLDRVIAIVGDSAITWNELIQAVNARRAQGAVLPNDVQGQLAFGREVLNDMIDQEILILQAHQRGDTVSEEDVKNAVDRQVRNVRAHYQSEADYRNDLKQAGFGSPDDYRRALADQIRREMLQRKVFGELSKDARPVNVSEDEVDAAYERARSDLQKRPATVTFRQIIITPKPSKAEDDKAHAKADSVLALLHHGGDFEELAKRESMDPVSAKSGGDLGWNRRGAFVPEFEQWMFALPPGQLSPVFKTSFGYHILRVDRVQPGEVKARHILIAPTIDSNDVHAAYLRADSAAALWRKGMSFDTLVAKYHDGGEEKGILQPYPIDSLPDSYKTAITDLKAGQVSEPFPLKAQNGSTKYAVLQVISRTAPGEYSLPEVRATIREQLQQEKQARAMLDGLRKQTYVSIRY